MFALTNRFNVPEGADWEAIRNLARNHAFIFAEMPQLVSKAFVLDETRSEFGGNYVWETKEAAEKFLGSDGFRDTVANLGWGEPTWTVSEIVAYVDRGQVVTSTVV